MPAIIIGFIMHMFVTLSAKNDSLDYVVKSSASSWLQEHMSDLSERYFTRKKNLTGCNQIYYIITKKVHAVTFQALVKSYCLE